MTLKKSVTISLAILLIVSLVSWQSIAEEETKPADFLEGYAPEFKIGVIQDLTGGASGFGIPIWNYLKLVVDEINANGGIDGVTKIVLVGYDCGSNPTEAINVFKRLVSLDKVDAVIGSTISNEMVVVAPVAEAMKIPTLSTSLDTKIVTNDDGSIRRYNFILQCTSKQQGYASAKYMVEEKGFTDLDVVYNEGNAYTSAIAVSFVECINKHYPEVAANMKVVTYGRNETDYSTFFSKAVDSNTQAVYIGCQHESVETIGQFRRLGYEIPIYGPNSYVPYLYDLPEFATGEIYYATGLDISAEKFAVTNRKYYEAYNDEIVAQAYQACDGLYMLIEAFRAGGGSTDSEDLIDNLMTTSVSGYQSDNFHFTPDCIPAGVSIYLGHITDPVNKVQETIAEMIVPNEWIEIVK